MNQQTSLRIIPLTELEHLDARLVSALLYVVLGR